MKKTQLKDALRNIWRQKVSFLSIVVIAMLAVTAYLGLHFCSAALRNNGNAFFNETNFRDIQVVSTKLVTPDDIKAIRSIDGVSDVEGVLRTSGIAFFKEAETSIDVVSLSQRINTTILREGAFPRTAEECVVEQELADTLGLHVGDSITVTDAGGASAAYLHTTSFCVSGIVFHAEHNCWTLMVPGNRNVLVLPEAFDVEALDGAFMTAEVLLDKAEKTDRFDKNYEIRVNEVIRALEILSEERTVLRDAQIHAKYEEQIEENQEKLDEAGDALQEARTQLDDGAAQIAENQTKLEDAEKTLRETMEQLKNGEAELSDAKAALDGIKEQLLSAEQELSDGRAELDEKRGELNAARRELDAAKKELEDGKKELDENAKILSDAEAELRDAEKELADGKKALDEGSEKLEAARAELEAGQAKLDDALEQLMEGQRELDAARQQLDAAEAELNAGQAELDAAEEQLLSGYAQIEEGKESVRDAIRSGMVSGLVSAGVPEENAAAAVQSIRWAKPNGRPDLDDPNIDVSVFQLTETIGFSMPDTDFAALADSVTDNFNLLFSMTLLSLSQQGIDVTSVAEREEAVRAAAEAELSAGSELEGKYNSAVEQMQAWNDGHAAYLSGKATLAEGRAQYNEGLAAYREGEMQLNYARMQYESGYAEYCRGAAEYQAGLAEYEKNKRLYEEGLAAYEDGKAQYTDGLARYEEGLKKYQDGLKEYEDGERQYADGLARFKDGEAQYSAALSEYNDGKRQYEQGLSDYADALRRYEDGVSAYENGKAQYEEGREKLAEGREALAEKEEEYAEHLSQYEEGLEQIGRAQDDLDALEKTRWIVLGPDGNGGFGILRGNVNNTGDMGITFAMIFILVGAMVVYATVGRIVEEQRRLVGATKALGLFNWEIFFKYLLFGVSATVIGMLFGSVLAYCFVEKILMGSYGRNYVYGSGAPTFLPGLTIVVMAGGVLLAVFTVWSACTELLRSTATKLMQEKTPSVRMKKGQSRTRSLYWRLVSLNMRSDKKRVAVTIISIAGCCTLLVTGFSLRSAVLGALEGQFTDVTLYDAEIRYDSEVSETVQEEIVQILQNAGADYMVLYRADSAIAVDGKHYNCALFCGDLSELDHYYVRRDIKTGALLSDDANGAFIHKRVAEQFGLREGDTFYLYDNDMKPYPIQVAGVFNIYVGRELILSEETYASVFGCAEMKNAFLIRLNGAEADALYEKVGSVKGVRFISESAELYATGMSYVSMLNMIVMILTGMAGIMACFILLNLANMYMEQKKRELTIMRVNGFTVREVYRYVAGEPIATTVIGTLLGFALGSLLTRRMIALLENGSLQFFRNIQWMSWLYAALFTLLFSVIIYAVALRKVKRLKLTDIA